MLYILLICYDPSRPATEASLQLAHQELEAELRRQGTFISGAGLYPVELGKSVRREDGMYTVTDGPFTESKETLGGYYIVDASEEDALDIARRIPVDDRSWVQVRPVGLFHPNIDAISRLEG